MRFSSLAAHAVDSATHEGSNVRTTTSFGFSQPARRSSVVATCNRNNQVRGTIAVSGARVYNDRNAARQNVTLGCVTSAELVLCYK